MPYRSLLIASTWLLASAAMAQTSPAVQSDSWAKHPAPASSAGYRVHSSTEASPTTSHFKFKDRNQSGPLSQPPPGANDKAAVMGNDRAWQNGRAPLDCAQTPMDSGCH
ncbi:hypothetical protein ACPPVV_15090 [Rhodanobacter sp. Col0626]|uniref:hypothetical protein n=1 Tax=Rhodanobacter sp. Col0626 TaxID=3415679 RepID=UPI003CF62C66